MKNEISILIYNLHIKCGRYTLLHLSTSLFLIKVRENDLQNINLNTNINIAYQNNHFYLAGLLLPEQVKNDKTRV